MKAPHLKRELPAKSGDIWWSRDRLLVAVFLAGTAVLLYCCYLLIRPFLPALAWALALAVIAHPIHIGLRRRVGSTLAAVLSVVIVGIMVVAPMTLVFRAVLNQANTTLKTLESGEVEKWLDASLDKIPRWSRAWDRLNSQIRLQDSGEHLATLVGRWTTRLVGGGVYGTISLLIAFFVLFYLLRDRDAVIDLLRSLLPLSDREVNHLFVRVRDSIFAAVYGTLSVAAVQGILGGLMFWWLGLPAALLWGVVMGLLAIIPVLGAFVIWIPAAFYLALQGAWVKAIVLIVWGLVVIGLIDNLLYPIVVGKRLRLHTVPVFISILGGLAVFGASGIILGPVILAVTDAALEVWRRRTDDNHSAASPVI